MPAGAGNCAERGFVLETSERCVLDRSRRRIPGIDLDDVSESVDLVGFCDQIEPLVEAYRTPSGASAVLLDENQTGEFWAKIRDGEYSAGEKIGGVPGS